jgi:hypothetical protein
MMASVEVPALPVPTDSRKLSSRCNQACRLISGVGDTGRDFTNAKIVLTVPHPPRPPGVPQ